MKAAVLYAPAPIAQRPLVIKEVPKPSPGPGEVLLRVLACGVCRTDLHILEGELPPLRTNGLILGHQIVGAVVDGATEALPLGTHVGISWMGGADGTCPYCRRGLENLCDTPTFTGYSVDGDMRSSPLRVRPLCLRCQTVWMRWRRLRCCAPESSVFEVYA